MSSLAMTLVLISLAKELVTELQALQKLSERASTSNELRYGVPEAFSNETIENIKNTYFSLNID